MHITETKYFKIEEDNKTNKLNIVIKSQNFSFCSLEHIAPQIHFSNLPHTHPLIVDFIAPKFPSDYYVKDKQISRKYYSTNSNIPISLNLELKIFEKSPCVFISNTIENNTNYDIYINKFIPFKFIISSKDDINFFQQGWQSWSPSRFQNIKSRIFDTCDEARKKVIYPLYENSDYYNRPDILFSSWMTILATPDYALLIGVLSGDKYYSQISARKIFTDKFEIAATIYCENYKLSAGRKFTSPTFMFTSANSTTKIVGNYLDNLSKQLKYCKQSAAHKLPIKPFAGWCSWYYYFTEIDENSILENIEWAYKNRKQLPMNVLLIDDGYQEDVGDWLSANKKFPSGMKMIVKKVKKYGFIPGIWLAPFSISGTSETFRKHPDWILRNANEEPVETIFNWGKSIYGLDTTNPEVKKYLKKIFAVLTKEWGFEVFKLDFLFSACADGIHFRKNTTRIQAYCEGLRTIRNVLKNKFIIACGAPIYPSINFADAMRIGPDTAVNWLPHLDGENSIPSAKNAITNILNQFFWNKKVWFNDPDCILTRGAENEVKTFVSLVFLSGGLVLNGDSLRKLSILNQKILGKLLPAYGKTAQPIKWGVDGRLPEKFFLPITKQFDKWYIVGLFNWDDFAKPVSLDFEELPILPDCANFEKNFHGTEFWTETYHVFDIKNTFIIEGHSCLLFSIRKNDINAHTYPQLVFSNLHLTQGGVEIKKFEFDRKLKVLSIEIKKSGEHSAVLYLKVPTALLQSQNIRFFMRNNQDNIEILPLKTPESSREQKILKISFEFSEKQKIFLNF